MGFQIPGDVESPVHQGELSAPRGRLGLGGRSRPGRDDGPQHSEVYG